VESGAGEQPRDRFLAAYAALAEGGLSDLESPTERDDRGRGD
jgi:hypothetical protein